MSEKGTVKWFNPTRGYGFLLDEEGNDVFVHYTALEMEGFKTLNVGQEVKYEKIPGRKSGEFASQKVTILN